MVILAISIVIFTKLITVSYLILKRIRNRTLSRILDKVKQKLFFNAFLRYIVTAYLKLFIMGVELV